VAVEEARDGLQAWVPRGDGPADGAARGRQSGAALDRDQPPTGETGPALFTPDGHEKPIGEFQSLSFRCDDVDKEYAVLKATGVEFDNPPQKQPWGTFVIFSGPDGNKFALGS